MHIIKYIIIKIINNTFIGNNKLILKNIKINISPIFQVIDILKRKAKLIEYHFSVVGYDVNPLAIKNKWTYR